MAEPPFKPLTPNYYWPGMTDAEKARVDFAHANPDPKQPFWDSSTSTWRDPDTGRPWNGPLPTNASKPGMTANGSLDLSGLTGDARDAAVALQNIFKGYGLDTLAPKILDFVKQGYSADTISILLQDTDEYKKRFAGNQERLKANIPVLSPAEYLATESAYRQIMQAAGVPSGFYDSPDDFAAFIGKDVSPTEIQGRVQAATDLVNSAPPEALAMFKQFYSTGDIIAYALDPTKAEPLVEKRIKAASLAGVGASQGVGVGQATAEQMAAAGITQSQAQSGFGFVAGEQPTANKLGAIYGDGVTSNDLVQEAFFNDATSTKKRAKLASKERATFGGSSGLTSQSLSTNDAGAF